MASLPLRHRPVSRPLRVARLWQRAITARSHAHRLNGVSVRQATVVEAGGGILLGSLVATAARPVPAQRVMAAG